MLSGLFDTTITVKTQSVSTSASGEQIEAFNTSTSVNCRSYSYDENITDNTGRTTTRTVTVFICSPGTSVTIKDKITHNSIDMQVISVNPRKHHIEVKAVVA